MSENPTVTAQPLPPGFELKTQRHEFRIVSKIASGGFGITYQAVNLKAFMIRGTSVVVPVGTVLAIKECFKKDCMVRDASFMARPLPGCESMVRKLREQFLSEAFTLVKLQAEAPAERRAKAGLLGYVPAFHAGTATKRHNEANVHYFVMPFLSGGSLSQYIGNMPAEYVVRVAYRLLRALQLLHRDAEGNRNPLLHCDIKPANIMLTSKSEPVLIDFGISSAIQNEGGTPDFSPHEQIRRQATGPYTDLYSLGATLYYLITSTRPPRYDARPPYAATDAYVPLYTRPALVSQFSACGAAFEKRFVERTGRPYNRLRGDFATTFLWAIDMAMRASSPNAVRWRNAGAWLDAVFQGRSPIPSSSDSEKTTEWIVDPDSKPVPQPEPIPLPLPPPVPPPVPPAPSDSTNRLLILVLVLLVALVVIILTNIEFFISEL